MLTYLWIAVGSALGGMARYGVSRLFAFWVGETFPWGTLVVNVTGCFLIGILAAVTGPDGRVLVPPDFRQFLLVGICGGYTTFSSFGLQTLTLVRDGDMLQASANVLMSVIFCLIVVWLGSVVGAWVNQARGGF